jgi:hypothetical protein
LPFGHRHSLLGSSCARQEVQPSSRSAHQTTASPGPRRGCHVPHDTDTTGVGALCTPGTVVRSRPAKSPRAAPAASQLPAPISRSNIPSARLLMTRRQRGFMFFTHPVFPSLWPPGGTATLRPFPGLCTPQLPATHAKAGTVLTHWTGHYTFDNVEPPSVSTAVLMRPRVARPGSATTRCSG